MRLIRRPSPAMIIAIAALFAATAGTSVAAISLGGLSSGAKNKTVGVGKLTYVQTSTTIPDTSGLPAVTVAAQCPGGLRVIGGGIKETNQNNLFVEDSYPTTSGWTGHVQNDGPPAIAITSAICAASRKVTGSPPAS